ISYGSLPGSMGQRFQTSTNDIEVVTGNVVVLLGGKYIFSPELSVGASLQLPSLQAHSEATLHFVTAGADPSASVGSQSVYTLYDQQSPAQMRYAPALRLGASYLRRHRYTVAVDVRVHAPVKYTLVDVDPAYQAALSFNPDIVRNAVVNFNVGAEVLVVREVSVSAGIFSDFSTAPPIAPTPSRDQASRVDLLGLTASLGYFGDYTLSRLGFVYSFGQGQDVIPTSTAAQAASGVAQPFSRVRYFQSFFYVFLSSSFRY
ncbi:MAG TPA: hypothetical protein VFH51_04985, partial [Myxococcota bacterium]|nr:hypothetical protein [Myxococcota bacterium]